ncbi:LysR family transcriptional regulator substrate-binding protein [Comamonas sp. JC664]
MRAQVSWMIATFDQAWRRCSSGCSTRAAIRITASIGIAVDCAVHGPVPAAPPEVHFVLDDMHSDTLIESITQGDADIAVGLHFDMPAHIDSRLITSDEIVVVVSPRHPLAQQAKLHWHDLKDQPLAVLRRGNTYT